MKLFNAYVRNIRRKLNFCLMKITILTLCYKSYRDAIKEHNPVERIGTKIYFEFYNENFDVPVHALDHEL